MILVQPGTPLASWSSSEYNQLLKVGYLIRHLDISGLTQYFPAGRLDYASPPTTNFMKPSIKISNVKVVLWKYPKHNEQRFEA